MSNPHCLQSFLFAPFFGHVSLIKVCDDEHFLRFFAYYTHWNDDNNIKVFFSHLSRP